MLLAADEIPLQGLTQLGGVGAVLAITFWFFYKVWQREASRADINDAEVKRLNELIQSKYVPSLELAGRALIETNQLIAELKARRRST